MPVPVPTVTGEESLSGVGHEGNVVDPDVLMGRATTTFPNTQQAFSTAVSESLWVFRVLSTVCTTKGGSDERRVNTVRDIG